MAEFYRVVRVRPNGSETILRDIPIVDATAEQMIRADAFADAATRKDSGIHVRVYSSNHKLVTPDDLIWDSAVNL